MNRGAWRATVHGLSKELDTTEHPNSWERRRNAARDGGPVRGRKKAQVKFLEFYPHLLILYYTALPGKIYSKVKMFH